MSLWRVCSLLTFKYNGVSICFGNIISLHFYSWISTSSVQSKNTRINSSSIRFRYWVRERIAIRFWWSECWNSNPKSWVFDIISLCRNCSCRNSGCSTDISESDSENYGSAYWCIRPLMSTYLNSFCPQICGICCIYS